MDDISSGQLKGTAAEIYEDFFVPALFAQFAPRLADALDLAPGQKVLDVACGTGVVTREAARRVCPEGEAHGLDRNEAMLAVARRLATGVAWHQGRAEALPFADEAFDAVSCQFALMFFEDRLKALAEMWRVLRPGGRMAVAVWAEIGKSPGYAAMADLLDRLFGPQIAAALHAPFALGDREALRRLFVDAGIGEPMLAILPGTARFASVDAWVYTEIKGWTLADALDETQYERLLAEARREFGRYAGENGRVAFASPAVLATATKS